MAEGTGSQRREPSSESLLASGFAAGIVVTGALNPVDKALFLSVAKRRAFLHHRNWEAPFQGLMQSLFGRAFSSGLWFPLERMAMESPAFKICAATSHSAAVALAGQAAGALNAVLLSPFAFVKYQTWGLPDGERGFYSVARKASRAAGPTIFFRGLPATVLRDSLFGGCFSLARQRLRAAGLPHFGADFVAAGAATVLSAPLNYARNIQFGAPWGEPTPPAWRAIRRLWQRAGARPTVPATLYYLCHRTKVGWGTLRVAGGMAVHKLSKLLSLESLQRPSIRSI
jgi:hypothetical protein